MSSSRQTHSQFSKASSDPQRVIKPILQSRKKPEKKPADFRPISTQAVNPKSSPARKSEKPKKDQEPGLLTYKEQRDLRCRNSDVQKTEKKTLNEIEKIQNTIRKTPKAQDFPDACNEMRKIVTTNSKTPSLSNHILFSELFKSESNESGSVKDRICRQFLQKFAEKKNSLEEFKVDEEVKTSKDEKIDDDQNLSFEDPNLFMPEIPFFQYNYTNYEVLESDLSCFDISEKLEDSDPYPGTISLMYEIFLDTENYNLITTKTYNHELLKLPSINPVFIRDVGKITVNKSTNFDQENIQKPKPVIKILKRFSLECAKKPVSGLFYEEESRKTVKILSKSEFVPETKPVLSDLLMRKFESYSKFLCFCEFSQYKARVMTKPLIVLQEDHKKPKLVIEPQVESHKILIDSCASPIILPDRISLFESQTSFDSLQFTLSKQSSLDKHCQPFAFDSVPQTPVFSFPAPENSQFNSILAVLVSKLKISQERALQALKKRKQESALFVLFSIKKHSTLFNHFENWKNFHFTRLKSEYIPDSKTIEKFLNYSATFIQRNWKGFFVRKFVVPSMVQYKIFKNKLKATLIGWKTRKILTTRRMQGHFKTIKDLHIIINDMNKDPPGSSDNLLPRFIDELPKAHSKMIKDFNSLYRTGTWVALLKAGQAKFLDSGKFSEKPSNFRISNRDEMPIKPLQLNYDDLPTETEPVFTQPKKIFRNFLKRKSKTVSVPDNSEKTVNATEETKEKQEGNLRFKEKNNVIQEQLEDIEEENMPEDKKFEGKPKEFLKRKSQSIKPKKLQWNVKRKIDCWVSKDVYNKKTRKIQNVVQKEFFNIEELETIFEESLRNFVDTSVYLKKFERIAAKTKIPQFRNCSDFLFGVKEENYYEILEELESHYLHLCTQGIRL